MLRSRRTAANGLNVRATRGVQGQLHQRGLSRRSTPNSVRTTMRRLSLCRCGMPQSGHAALGGQRGGGLVLDHRVLYRGEQVFGFFQLQAKGFRREGAA